MCRPDIRKHRGITLLAIGWATGRTRGREDERTREDTRSFHQSNKCHPPIPFSVIFNSTTTTTYLHPALSTLHCHSSIVKTLQHSHTTMDTRPFTNTSPQGLGVNGAATNVSTHQTINDTINGHYTSQPTHVGYEVPSDPTHDAKTSKKRKFEEVDSDNVHQQSTGSPKKTPKLDHPSTPTSPQDEFIDFLPTPPLPQEPNEEAANSAQTRPPEQEISDDDAEFSSEEEEEEEGVINFNLPDYSLAHRGRFAENCGIIFETHEPNHNATLAAIIEHRRNDIFICNFRVQIEGVTKSWVGWCGIPAAEMDRDVANYYHRRTRRMDGFNIAKVSMGTTFEDLRGIVRLGSVVGEEYVLGTYTCQAEFFKFGTASPWAGQVYVPKKDVPGYKLVDYEGEKGQDVAASIETVSEAQTAHEKEAETMLIELWSPSGEHCYEDQPTHILAYAIEGDDQILELHFRVKDISETAYWHFHGRMDRDLTHGRFQTGWTPVAKAESDLQFGAVWSDPTVGGDIEQRLQDIQISA
jgi:hypothetical protein